MVPCADLDALHHGSAFLMIGGIVYKNERCQAQVFGHSGRRMSDAATDLQKQVTDYLATVFPETQGNEAGPCG